MSESPLLRHDIRQTTWPQFGCLAAMLTIAMPANCDGTATTPLCSIGNTGVLVGFSPVAGIFDGFDLRQRWQGSGSSLAEK
jgi:hypothetical protein